MTPTTTSNGQGLESGKNNANGTHNKNSNSEILKKEENGPFIIITLGDKSFVTMGKYRLTDPKTKEECDEWIKEITWEKIVTVMHVIVEAEKNWNALPPEQQDFYKEEYQKNKGI